MHQDTELESRVLVTSCQLRLGDILRDLRNIVLEIKLFEFLDECFAIVFTYHLQLIHELLDALNLADERLG